MKNIKIKLLLVFIAINFSVLKPKKFDIPYIEEQIKKEYELLKDTNLHLYDINIKLVSYKTALLSSKNSHFDKKVLELNINLLKTDKKEQLQLKCELTNKLNIFKNYLNFCESKGSIDFRNLKVNPKVLTSDYVDLLLEILVDSPEVGSLYINSAFIDKEALKNLFINIYNKKTSVRKIFFLKSNKDTIHGAFRCANIKYYKNICEVKFI